jgi:uncharacterized spore protein YtfJ
MSNNVSEYLQSMFSKMENFISTKTVVGEPVNYGDIILVPLVEVTFGSGSGISESKEAEQQGGGAIGARLTPVAVVVIVDGTAQLINVKHQESVNKLIDMIPGVLSKFNLDFTKKSDSKTSSNISSEGASLVDPAEHAAMDRIL